MSRIAADDPDNSEFETWIGIQHASGFNDVHQLALNLMYGAGFI